MTGIRYLSALVLSCALAVSPVFADSSSGKLDSQGRVAIIRSLNAEMAFAKIPFPRGEKGLTIEEGKVTPEGTELQMLVANFGPAAKAGDRVRITNIEFKGDKLIFEINGGPKKKAKWYQRIQVSGMGGATNVAAPPPETSGSKVELKFEDSIPNISPDEVKKLLDPVLDFNARTRVQAIMTQLPEHVQQALKDKRVLVGMDRELVTFAKGRPPKKVRETQDDVEFEEWIYGAPPQDVEFIRFVGDEVVQVKLMKITGERIVRTEREVDLSGKKAEIAKKIEDAREEQAQGGPKKPTLRRPGEAGADGTDTDAAAGAPVKTTDPRIPKQDQDPRVPRVDPRVPEPQQQGTPPGPGR